MSKLKCQLNIVSLSPHISQVLTGFSMLKNESIIDLEIKYSPERLQLYPTPHMVEAIIDNKITVAYDMLDGYNFNRLETEKYLRGIDCYFKRSYNIEHHKDFEHSSRIYPFGFNYHVTFPENIIDLNGEISGLRGLERSVKYKLFSKQHNFFVEQFEDVPRYNDDTLILFLARAWDPKEEGVLLDDQLKAEREHINKGRAECISKLRENFGDKFIGGFSPSSYALNKFPSYVVDNALTERTNFMRLVKKASTCVATIGLHESNGWKLAEYIAASKAIVSEKLRYAVPGNFNNVDNYLEFINADHCVEQVMKLENNKELAFTMKINNYIYYNNFLRADRLIYNTLAVALKNLPYLSSK